MKTNSKLIEVVALNNNPCAHCIIESNLLNIKIPRKYMQGLQK